MTRWTLATLLLLLGALVESGCHSPHCRSDSDCSAGEVCASGTCGAPQDGGPACAAGVPTCSRASQCPTKICTDGCCVENACHVDADCVRGQNCIGGLCQATSAAPTPCTSSAACTATPATPVCLVSQAVCVECLTTPDCPDPRKECSMANTCVFAPPYCTTSADCFGMATTSVCDTTSNYCVACVVASDCGTGLVCAPSESCVPAPVPPCSTDMDCAATAATPYCDPDNGLCVECTDGSECSSGNTCQHETCLPPTCGVEADCATDTQASHCNQMTGRCAQCASTSQCPAGQTCQSGVCATSTCTTFADCQGLPSTPYCNQASGSCVQCTNYAECPNAQVCEDSMCRATTGSTCTSDADCAQQAVDPYCDIPFGQCVPCVTGSTTAACTTGVCKKDDCILGCPELVKCMADCAGAATCQTSCLVYTSAATQAAYTSLTACLAAACPVLDGGVCDPSAPGSSGACQSCESEAEEGGSPVGPCFNVLNQCTATTD